MRKLLLILITGLIFIFLSQSVFAHLAYLSACESTGNTSCQFEGWARDSDWAGLGSSYEPIPLHSDLITQKSYRFKYSHKNMSRDGRVFRVGLSEFPVSVKYMDTGKSYTVSGGIPLPNNGVYMLSDVIPVPGANYRSILDFDPVDHCFPDQFIVDNGIKKQVCIKNFSIDKMKDGFGHFNNIWISGTLELREPEAGTSTIGSYVFGDISTGDDALYFSAYDVSDTRLSDISTDPTGTLMHGRLTNDQLYNSAIGIISVSQLQNDGSWLEYSYIDYHNIKLHYSRIHLISGTLGDAWYYFLKFDEKDTTFKVKFNNWNSGSAVPSYKTFIIDNIGNVCMLESGLCATP